MTNVAISGLPAAVSPLTGSELGIVVQSGVTCKVSSSAISAGGTYIDCRDFAGLDPTGSSDSSGAINNAIQAGITHRLPVYLCAGKFKISSPLLFNNYGLQGTSFTNIHFFGAGMGSNDSNSPSTARTAIFPTFNTLPAIAIGPCFNTTVRDLAIFGLNVAPQQYIYGGTPGYPVDIQSDYITAGCRSNPYSPYCAIVIDGLNVSNPGGSSSNQYPGMTYSNGAGGSNFCSFENLYITGFVVGIAYGISGANLNSDDLSFRNVQIWWCDTAYACGNTQADNCEIVHGNIFGCRQGIDGLNYGAGTGAPPRLRNVNLQYLYRVFTVPNSFGGLYLDGCYGESLRSLGNFGVSIGAGVRYSLTVTGGTYGFFGHASYFGIGPSALLLLTYGPTRFIGTSIVLDGFASGWDALNILCTGMPVTFENCTFSGPSAAYVPPIFLSSFDTTLGQVRITDCWISGASGAPSFLFSDDYLRSYSTAQFCPGGRFIASYQSRRIPDANLELIFQPYSASPTTAAENTVYVIFATVGSVTITTTGAGSLSFTVQTTYLQPGDILMWGVSDRIVGLVDFPSVKVTSYTYSSAGATTATCSLLFDPSQYASAPPQPNQIAVVLKHWAPAVPLSCTTHGTTSLTSVAPTTILQNGDWLIGSGLAYGTRVLAGGGTANITLSQACSSNAVNVSLYFGRLYIPTLTAAF